MPMLARDLMSTTVTTVSPNSTIAQAARLMLDNNASCLPVVDEQDDLVGILTHTDFGLHPKFRPLVENIYSMFGASTSVKHLEDLSHKVGSKLVKEVMSHPVTSVEADTPIEKIIEQMLNRGIHRMPVTEGKRVIGVITRHDFLKLIAAPQ